jgi:tetratricopeptide (TPR) repeat protein
MGNNEMIGPYGASTVFGSKAPPVRLVRASLAAGRSRIGQSMKSLAEGIQRVTSDPAAWGGINMFTENPLRPGDPARQAVYRNFRTNLEDILAAGEKAGVQVLLSTVGGNLRDCAPFIPLNAAGLAGSRLAEWNSHYEKGNALEAAGSHAEALSQYRMAEAIDGGHAGLHYRMGRCHGLLGDLEAAHAALVKARDLDGLVVRADSTINRIIRETAAARGGESVILMDAEAFLAGESPGGLPGRELFYEHVHFTLEGNYRMARFFAERVAGLLPSEVTAGDTGSWAGAGACQLPPVVALLGTERLWKGTGERLASPPFTFRENNAASLAFCQSNAAAFRGRMNPQLDRMVYEKALAENPDDHFLLSRFGRYLQLNGAIPEAVPHLRRVTRDFPGFEGGHQDLGIALLLLGQHDEAEKSFRRVLQINPHYAKAHQALELIAQHRRP